MSINNTIIEDATMVDTTNPLEMAKTTITTMMKNGAEDLKMITTTIASGQPCSNDLLAQCEENAKLLERTKALFNKAYPLEPMFAPVKDIKVPNIEANQVPGLRSETDPLLPGPIGDVYLDVTKFIQHFERIFKFKELNIDLFYNRYLEWSLGKAYAQHIANMRANMTQDTVENWEMIKTWLLQYKDTPAQRWKNLCELSRITLQHGESSDQMCRRVLQDAERLGLDRFSAAELLVAGVLRYRPDSWNQKVVYTWVEFGTHWEAQGYGNNLRNIFLQQQQQQQQPH
ncbi:hypothetical protein [Absidia glauca]|uniref:Uncharacterized protein n=1 Tax=Absidia glauca TaxID=4829 RepID=A0A168R753_ABSGL|nr:hypothetical protein [Absidia glauca]